MNEAGGAPAWVPGTRLRPRAVRIAGHRTSLSVEDAFWDRLKAIAGRRGLSINRLIEEIDTARAGNLSSAVRVYVLNDVMQRDREEARDDG